MHLITLLAQIAVLQAIKPSNAPLDSLFNMWYIPTSTKCFSCNQYSCPTCKEICEQNILHLLTVIRIEKANYSF